MNESHVLGICCTGHGASIALASSRYGVRALGFDRFTRKKNSMLFSRDELAEIRADQTDSGVLAGFRKAFGALPPSFAFEDSIIPYLEALLQGLPLTRHDIDSVVTSRSYFCVNPYRLGHRLKEYFPNADVVDDLEHHEIHQYQAFLPSPFESAAVLTMDTCGEPLERRGGAQLAMTFGEGQASTVRTFCEFEFPESSPGSIYAVVNRHVGFWEGEEGKTMGLAPYGRATLYERLKDALILNDDGSFSFLSIGALESALNEYCPPRAPGAPITREHEDVAYAGQAVLTRLVTHAVHRLFERTGQRNLCISGGVGLNSVANEIAFKDSGFERLYVSPNSGDPGQALACALYGLHHRANHPRTGLMGDDHGPPYSEASHREAIEAAGLAARLMSSEAELCAEVSRLIADGAVVGWFQGGSEYGPRALGQRSLLADPRRAELVAHLNSNVKHREGFRPFAPAVLEEEAPRWFALADASPFMLRVVNVRSEVRALVPAVVHVDGTARVQTVSAQQQPLFHELISAFRRHTDIPMVLNTSFNVAGEPIVERPSDAVACFLSTSMDALVVGRYLLVKEASARGERPASKQVQSRQ